MSRSKQGFTLIELMSVVAIVGVLAAIAVPSFINYIRKSRASEATTFLGAIRQRQESYRSEFGTYATPSTSINAFTPATLVDDGRGRQSWAGSTEWDQLGARPDSDIYFQYSSVGGLPGGAVPVALLSDLSLNDFWFIARAQGDLDGDGTLVTFETHSRASGIWCSESKGWE